VEFSREIVARCSSNVERFRTRRPELPPIQLIHSDAAEFRIPEDASVFFLFNPFKGALLENVVQNIRSSLLAAPRPREPIVVYVNPVYGSVLEANGFFQGKTLSLFKGHVDARLYFLKSLRSHWLFDDHQEAD
jgi:hypothetical protein